MLKNKDYSKLEDILMYKFKDISLLDTAFKHKSYANESVDDQISYERFE